MAVNVHLAMQAPGQFAGLPLSNVASVCSSLQGHQNRQLQQYGGLWHRQFSSSRLKSTHAHQPDPHGEQIADNVETRRQMAFKTAGCAAYARRPLL